MQAVLYPDSEALLTSYLRTAIDPFFIEPIHVGTDIPNPRPSEFIRLFRTGGPRMNQVADNPQITLEAWALNEDLAYDIMSHARALIIALVGTAYQGIAFYRMEEFSGPQLLIDESETPKYVWTFVIGVRGEAL